MATSIPLRSLIQYCHALKHGLDIGLSPVKMFRQQAKSGPVPLREISGKVAERLEKGDSLNDAFREHQNVLPTLFLDLVHVGERTGRLPDLFAELETYYETLESANRQLKSNLFKPAVTYVIATLVITLLIFILGQLTGISGRPVDPLGIGLTGSSGAFVFFLSSATFAGIVIFLTKIYLRSEKSQAKMEGFALRLPGIGGCLQAFALNRYCLAMHAAFEAGMKADECVKLSLRVTANEQYQKIAGDVAKQVRKGEELGDVLGAYASLFPDDHIQALRTGEETGRIAEVLKKESERYREEANRKLRTLTAILSGVIYAFVTIMVIVAIFKIFNNTLGAAYNDAFNAAENPDKWLRGG